MNDKFYFVVAGSREYQNYIEFSHIMDMLLKNYDYKKLVIVSGGAIGTDKMAEQYCEEQEYSEQRPQSNGHDWHDSFSLHFSSPQ